MGKYRIHGDNIVECERIANLIFDEINPQKINCNLISPSTISFQFDVNYCNFQDNWTLELLPGFNKAGRSRWEKDIFNSLREHGSFLDETPDAIITKIDGETEEILCAIEFCSALQAGNQAWQRSGRAFSTGRTGCPYLYIVDFVKYELDSKTRKRKNLRFPNAAVPYSYISFSKETGNFVAQTYIKSEEFDRQSDTALKNFNEDDFALNELSSYIVKRMAVLDTSSEENAILQKNLNVVLFLSESAKPQTNFTKEQWKRLYTYHEGIVSYAKQNAKFNFHKTITAKGHHGKSKNVVDIIDKYSVGLASRDLPFGIIPSKNRPAFASALKNLYPNVDVAIFDAVASQSKDLILCLIKGFKPKGDDNRPDRGLLPLASMLSSYNVDIMTYLYGPIYRNNFQLLEQDPYKLAKANGLWRSILGLSNFVLLDVPILGGTVNDAELLLNSSDIKAHYTNFGKQDGALKSPVFSSTPTSYHEDDVDTGIHYIFAHLMRESCFEGMCNPPGGDWSGFSIIDGDRECRWLSLPRVSDEISGKRPDHILELFGIFKKPLLLAIESKERAVDLEPDVGNRLINYIKALMGYTPSVERIQSNKNGWHKASRAVNFDDFETISAAAYLKSSSRSTTEVFSNSNCDMLFIMEPLKCGWEIEIVTQTEKSNTLKHFIANATKMHEIVII